MVYNIPGMCRNIGNFVESMSRRYGSPKPFPTSERRGYEAGKEHQEKRERKESPIRKGQEKLQRKTAATSHTGPERGAGVGRECVDGNAKKPK